MPPHRPSLAHLSILLDLDGTIVDTQPGILSSCHAVLCHLGHDPIIPVDAALVVGPPLEDAMRSLLRLYDDDRVAEAVEAFRANYDTEGLLKSTVYPGVFQVLQNIKGAGAHLFVATSKRRVPARKILDYLQVAALFEGIYGAEPGGDIDHKPELIAHIMARHSIRAENCLMVGDRSYDVVGAHANHVSAAGVLWGYGSRQELEMADVDFLLGTPGSLISLVYSQSLLTRGASLS